MGSAIQLSTLEFIAARRYLNLYSEYSLFNAIISWGMAECKRRSINANDWTAVRNVLEDTYVTYARKCTLAKSHINHAYDLVG